MNRIIGVDLSLTGTGISDGISTWLITSTGHKGDNLQTRQRRLSVLRAQVLQHCYQADLVVIEQPAYSSKSGHMHDRSGLWWLIVADLHDRNTPVAEVTPSALKRYATGKGNCAKSAITDVTARRFPDVDTGSGDDNRCDALWLAAMGIDQLTGYSVVPAAQREGLQRVHWPAPSEAAA